MKTYDEISREVLSRIDKEKANPVKKGWNAKLTALAAAAAVLIVGVVGITVYQNSLKPGSSDNIGLPETTMAGNENDRPPQQSGAVSGGVKDLNQTAIEKHIIVSSSPGQTEEIFRELRWDEMTDPQRYSELKCEDRVYSTAMAVVPTDRQGEYLGRATVDGYDGYEDKIRSAEVDIYAITDIDSEAAVAVRFDDSDECYTYVNAYWTPENLGEFVEKLNLRKELETGVCIYSQHWFMEEDGISAQGITDFAFEDIRTQDVLDMLLSDAALVNEPDKLESFGYSIIDIAVNVDVLGCSNLSLALTNDGYIVTNILQTGKCFNIGRDKVDEFVRFVTENHQAYKYVYDYTAEEIEE